MCTLPPAHRLRALCHPSRSLFVRTACPGLRGEDRAFNPRGLYVADQLLQGIGSGCSPQLTKRSRNLARRFLWGDGNRKSNLLPIHVSCRQGQPSRLCADFVLLILTSPVKRKFCFYDFRAFISFSLQCFVLNDTSSIILSFWRLYERLSRITFIFSLLKMLSMTSFIIMHTGNSGTGLPNRLMISE